MACSAGRNMHRCEGGECSLKEQPQKATKKQSSRNAGIESEMRTQAQSELLTTYLASSMAFPRVSLLRRRKSLQRTAKLKEKVSQNFPEANNF